MANLLARFAKRVLNDRLFLLTLAAGVAIISLSLLGLLYIQAIMIAWSILMFYLIIRIEKKKTDIEQSSGYPALAWYSLSEELNAIDRELRSSRNEERNKELIARRREIERRLREASWGMREDEFSSLYSSSKPMLRPSNIFDVKKMEKMIRKKLNWIDKECKDIMNNEPSSSRALMLERLSNEIRALYWMARGKEHAPPAVADLWVAWCIIESAKSSKPFQSKVIDYATDGYKEKAISLASTLKVEFESDSGR